MVDACAACRDRLRDGHTGTCLGCGEPVAERDRHVHIRLARLDAPPNDCCRRCLRERVEAADPTGGPVFATPPSSAAVDAPNAPTAADD